MNARDDGGPAFPLPSGLYKGQPANLVDGSIGMTLRDYFASAALTGISAHARGPAEKEGETNLMAHARWAYSVADAMLKARQA